MCPIWKRRSFLKQNILMVLFSSRETWLQEQSCPSYFYIHTRRNRCVVFFFYKAKLAQVYKDLFFHLQPWLVRPVSIYFGNLWEGSSLAAGSRVPFHCHRCIRHSRFYRWCTGWCQNCCGITLLDHHCNKNVNSFILLRSINLWCEISAQLATRSLYVESWSRMGTVQ